VLMAIPVGWRPFARWVPAGEVFGESRPLTVARNSRLAGADFKHQVGTASAVVEAIALMSVVRGIHASARRWRYALLEDVPVPVGPAHLGQAVGVPGSCHDQG